MARKTTKKQREFDQSLDEIISLARGDTSLKNENLGQELAKQGLTIEAQKE